MSTLAGTSRPDLKFKRAEGHFDCLTKAVDAYRYGGAFSVEQTPRTDEPAVDFALRIAEAPPLDEWSLIVGDCVHNLRAALDQMAWQLDSNPKTGPGGTSFPILTKAPTTWPTSTVARMPAGAWPVLRAVQPFTEPTPDRISRHPLATLNALDIGDKHHVLIAAVVKVAGDSIGGLPFGASLESAVFPSFVDGAVVGSVTYPDGQPTPTLTAGISFDLVLVDPPWANANVLFVLDELLLTWIGREVLAPLAAFIPNPPWASTSTS